MALSTFLSVLLDNKVEDVNILAIMKNLVKSPEECPHLFQGSKTCVICNAYVMGLQGEVFELECPEKIVLPSIVEECKSQEQIKQVVKVVEKHQRRDIDKSKCGCGSVVLARNYVRHLSSKKHQTWERKTKRKTE